MAPASSERILTIIRRLLSALIIYITIIPSIALAEHANLGEIEVHELLQQPSQWVVLDARPIKNWKDGHIPDAISFDWNEYTKQTETEIKYCTLPPEVIAVKLGKLGINQDTPLVIYGDADSSWGSEGWACWTLSWLGHKGPIRLLYGGIQAWEKENLRLSKSSGKNHTTTEYRTELRPELNISTASLMAIRNEAVVVDVRSTFEWFRGHLPGAIHLPWDNLYSGQDRRPIMAEQYRKLLQKHEIDPTKTVVFYCSGGIRSGYAWLVHQLSGYSNAINYEGGMEEWDKLTNK